MAVRAWIIEESSIRLWGLTSRERLQRVLAKYGVTNISDEEHGPVSVDDTILLLRGDFLYDQRILKNLVDSVGTVLEAAGAQGRRPVAAHVKAELADPLQAILKHGTLTEYPEGLTRETPESLVSAYLMELRKFDTPYLLPIHTENRKKLEKRLFDGSYKGVTDLVTKWIWPTPARWAVGFCTRHNIVPNQVTTLSLVLSILAAFLFYAGFYGSGLVLAWFMTFLDTVDGKLARVTINYSPWGNIYDHAIDLVFPPIWYVVWGLSLQSVPILSTQFSLWVVLVGYIAGRLVEVVFKQGLESSGIFCWQPIDS
ncbi:MAG: CDP-alcohol phosphatidyltransferase family protein, partial [Deltaproteobacteria bacterium]|nr:CDP-alcohol phosphatidyltransferase family protein [Deltaproteobacteria bacterium]